MGKIAAVLLGVVMMVLAVPFAIALFITSIAGPSLR